MNRAKFRSIVLLTAISVIGLLLSTAAVVMLILQGSQRAEDRRDAAAKICVQSNDLRENVRAIGEAGQELDENILDGVYDFASLSPEERAAINALLAPAFETYEEAVAKVKPIDCSTL